MNRQVTSSLSKQNELGVYVLVSTSCSAVTPINHSSAEDVVRGILRVWPAYRPLWITNVYRSPNGGLTKVHMHAIGSYDPTPRESRRIIEGLTLPSTRLYGIDWKHPIYLNDILDGLTDAERELLGDIRTRPNKPGYRRKLPRYVPLTHGTVGSIEQWRAQLDAADRAERRAEAIASADIADYVAYAPKHDKPLTPKSSRTRYVVEETKH